jgi:hypothetical protein
MALRAALWARRDEMDNYLLCWNVQEDKITSFKTAVCWSATAGKATCYGLSTGPTEPAASMVGALNIVRRGATLRIGFH